MNQEPKNGTELLARFFGNKSIVDTTIEQIPIESLLDNPDNFYGLRDIDDLAQKIAVSHVVEPLVVEKHDDKYMIISGHRRKAAWQRLLNEGIVENHNLPCVVSSFENINVKGVKFSKEKCAGMYLMFSNMGQRKTRTVEETLQEVERLEPIARSVFDALDASEKREWDSFRSFFAKTFLNMSSTGLQRLTVLKKLVPEAKEKINDGTFALLFGSELASLSSDNQRQYLSLIESGEQSPTVRALLAWKKDRREEKEEKRGEEPEDRFDEHPNFPDEDISFEPAEPSDDIEEESDASGETQPERANHVEQSVQDVKDKRVVCDIADIPNRISDPQSEAKSWLVSQQIDYLTQLKSYADAQAARDDDELISSQWKVRSSVLSVQILLLKG